MQVFALDCIAYIVDAETDRVFACMRYVEAKAEVGVSAPCRMMSLRLAPIIVVTMQTRDVLLHQFRET